MVERQTEATYIAECFWPDVHADEVQQGAERVTRSADELTSAGTAVTLTGTILVPGDEVVFYLFEGDSADVVREACARASVPVERVIESVHTAVRERRRSP